MHKYTYKYTRVYVYKYEIYKIFYKKTHIPNCHFLHTFCSQLPNLPKLGSSPKMANAIKDCPKFNATSKNASSA